MAGLDEQQEYFDTLWDRYYSARHEEDNFIAPVYNTESCCGPLDPNEEAWQKLFNELFN